MPLQSVMVVPCQWCVPICRRCSLRHRRLQLLFDDPALAAAVSPSRVHVALRVAATIHARASESMTASGNCGHRAAACFKLETRSAAASA